MTRRLPTNSAKLMVVAAMTAMFILAHPGLALVTVEFTGLLLVGRLLSPFTSPDLSLLGALQAPWASREQLDTTSLSHLAEAFDFGSHLSSTGFPLVSAVED